MGQHKCFTATSLLTFVVISSFFACDGDEPISRGPGAGGVTAGGSGGSAGERNGGASGERVDGGGPNGGGTAPGAAGEGLTSGAPTAGGNGGVAAGGSSGEGGNSNEAGRGASAREGGAAGMTSENDAGASGASGAAGAGGGPSSSYDSHACMVCAPDCNLEGTCLGNDPACTALQSCIYESGCAQGTSIATECYCGDVDFELCNAAQNPDVPNGVCKSEFDAASASTNPSVLLGAYFDDSLPLGRAMRRIVCQLGYPACATPCNL